MAVAVYTAVALLIIEHEYYYSLSLYSDYFSISSIPLLSSTPYTAHIRVLVAVFAYSP